MSKHQIDDSIWVWNMSGLMRDGKVEPVSRDQILRRERTWTGKNKYIPVQLTTSRIGNHVWLMHTLLTISDDHKYITRYIYR